MLFIEEKHLPGQPPCFYCQPPCYCYCYCQPPCSYCRPSSAANSCNSCAPFLLLNKPSLKIWILIICVHNLLFKPQTRFLAEILLMFGNPWELAEIFWCAGKLKSGQEAGQWTPWKLGWVELLWIFGGSLPAWLSSGWQEMSLAVSEKSTSADTINSTIQSRGRSPSQDCDMIETVSKRKKEKRGCKWEMPVYKNYKYLCWSKISSADRNTNVRTSQLCKIQFIRLNRQLALVKKRYIVILNPGWWPALIILEMTGETPEVRSDKRRREEREER